MVLTQGAESTSFIEIDDDRGYPWSLRSRYDFVNGVNRKVGMYNDPTYLGFFMFFQPNSPLLNMSNAPGSAYYYLNKVGEKVRVKYLESFAEILKDINLNMPWYWQSIAGLENAWKWKDMKEPYRGGDDAKITITTLESIDLKIAQLLELYRMVVYDRMYRREILPRNLRKFTLWIWVQEIRKFQLDQYLSNGKQNLDKKSIDTAKTVNENSPWILFQLDQCEFSTDASNPFLQTLSFSEPAPASNAVTIMYENVIYDFGPNLGDDLVARLNSLDDEDRLLKDTNFTIDKINNIKLSEKIKSKIQETAINAGKNLLAQAENTTKDAVMGYITSKYLGNVHGFSISGAIDAIQQSSLSAITGKFIR